MQCSRPILSRLFPYPLIKSDDHAAAAGKAGVAFPPAGCDGNVGCLGTSWRRIDDTGDPPCKRGHGFGAFTFQHVYRFSQSGWAAFLLVYKPIAISTRLSGLRIIAIISKESGTPLFPLVGDSRRSGSRE